MYFKDCQGVVCVYDVTNMKSLIDCDMWIKEAKKYIKEQDIEEDTNSYHITWKQIRYYR